MRTNRNIAIKSFETITFAAEELVGDPLTRGVRGYALPNSE